jgi:hypothetical protein
MSLAVSRLLDRLDRPKQVKPGQWMTGCPCCASRKGRPIAVTEADGRALLYAFCQCPTENVLGAIGLGIEDLFDAPLALRVEPTRVRVPAADILRELSAEVTFVAIVASDLAEGRSLSDHDMARLTKAAQLIGAARDYVG